MSIFSDPLVQLSAFVATLSLAAGFALLIAANVSAARDAQRDHRR